MNKVTIDVSWHFLKPDLIRGIREALKPGLELSKGLDAAQVREAFFSEVVRLAFESGCRTGYKVAKAEASE